MSTIELVILRLDLVLKCANSLKTDSACIKLRYLAFQFNPFINRLLVLSLLPYLDNGYKYQKYLV
jgi:hypothetical protein